MTAQRKKATSVQVLRIPGHAFSSASRYGRNGFPHRCACGVHSTLYDLSTSGMDAARQWHRQHKAEVVAAAVSDRQQRRG